VRDRAVEVTCREEARENGKVKLGADWEVE
jgi:hypothetical protein